MAGQVVTALNMKIGFNGKEVAAGAVQVRKDVAKVNSIVRKATTDTTKYEQAKGALIRRMEAGSITQKKFRKLLAEVHQQYVTGPARIRAEAEAQAKASRETQLAAIRAKNLAAAKRQQAEAEKAAARDAVLAAKQRQAAMAAETAAINKQRAAARRMFNEYKKTRAEQDKYRISLADLGAFVNPTTVAIGALAGGFFGLRKAISISAEFEQAAISLEVLTGSAEKGQSALAGLRKFAAETPITLSGAQSAASTLLAFGVQAERLMPTIKMLGDVSAGNQDRFNSLALAFGQISSAGRLMGQDLLQLINAGFNPLQVISEQTGESMLSLKKRMEDGKVSFAEVEAAFATATSEGGRFFGMMERQGKTFTGAVNQAKSAAQEMAASIGSMFTPALTKALNAITEVTKAITSYGGRLSELNVKMVASGASFLAFVTIGPRFISMIASVIGVIRKLIATQITLTALTGPKGWAMIAGGLAAAAASVALVDTAFASYSNSIDESTKSLQENAKAAGKAKAANDSWAKAAAERRMQGEMAAAATLISQQDEIQAMRLGAEYMERVQFARNNPSATRAQKEEFERQQKLIKTLKSRAELEERITEENKKRQQEVKSLMDQGRSMMETHNPVKAVESQMADLLVLLRVGAINEATFFKERNKVLAEQVKSTEMEQQGAMEVGSQQSATFLQKQIFDKVEQQIAVAEAQRLLQEAQLGAQRMANDKLAELAPVRPAR